MRKIMTGIAVLLAMALEANAASIALTPDADADIRSAGSANTGFDKDGLLVGNTNPDPSASSSFKGYIRFQLPADFGTATSATLTLKRSTVGLFNADYTVYGLNDGIAGETYWVEQDGTGMNWNDAPGNIVNSPSAFTNASAVGAFTTTGALYGGSLGDSWSISGSNLVDFLNADANGYVTLMIGRDNQNSSSDEFASKEHATYAAPELDLEYTTFSGPGVVPVAPEADATVNSGSPSSNYGSATTLAVKSAGDYASGQKCYLRFQLPTGQEGTLVDAKLVLIRTQVAAWQYYVNLYGLNDNVSGQSWSETGITWNNAPGNDPASNSFDPAEVEHLLSKEIAGTSTGHVPGYVGEEINLESPPWAEADALVEFLESDTDGVVNLMLTTGFTATYVNTFASKEHATYQEPTLVLTYSTETNTPSFKSTTNELATVRWNNWRLDRERFPTAAWDFFDYGGLSIPATPAGYQLYADANFSMIRVVETNYQKAVDAGLEVLLGHWEQLHQDPTQLAYYMGYPTPGDTNVVGYFLDDEPVGSKIAECGDRSYEVYAQDARDAIPAVNHFRPLEEVFAGDAPAYLVRTMYTLLTNDTTRPIFYQNLEEKREAGLGYDIGMMGWALITRHDYGSQNFRLASESDVFWQVYSILGYGGHGVWYYRYTAETGKSILDAFDTPNPVYYHIQAANAELHKIWPVFKHLRSVGVFHSHDNPAAGIEGAESRGIVWNVNVYTNGDIEAIDSFVGDNFLLGEMENRDDPADQDVYVLIQNKRHAMDTASSNLTATCSFVASSNSPSVSVFDPSTGDEIPLSPQLGQYSLSLGGGKGVLVRFGAYSPLEAWAVEYGLHGTNALAEADPDGDLATNFKEFAFAGNPTNETFTGHPLASQVDGAGGSNWLDLVHVRCTVSSNGLVYGIEECTNLVEGVWEPSVSLEVGADALDDSYEFVTNRIDIGEDPARFLRVRATGE